MAVWSISSLSSIRSTNRNDAEFFQPTYKKLDDKLNSTTFEKLAHIANITDGIHASPEIAENGIQYISAKCVKDNYFVTDHCIKISQKQNELNIRTQLRENDIIITTVGTIGNVAVVDKEMLPSNCDRHVGIIRIKEKVNISPYFISTFLNSKYGYFQSLRESAGNVQLNLYVKSIGNIKIPRFKHSEATVSSLTDKAYELRRLSEYKYIKAQEILEQELGLDRLKFEKPVGYEANFSEAIFSSRMDAEYFQPKFIKLIETLTKKAGLIGTTPYKIRELLRSSPKYGTSTKLKYINEGVPFLRIADLSNIKFEKDNLKYISSKDAIQEKSAQVNTDDILISRSGTLGLTVCVPSELDGSIFGSYFIRLQLNSKINPLYFSFYMNSLAGKMQVKRYNTGGVQTNLTIPAIESFLVVPLRPQKEEHILALLKKSEDCIKESKQLLEKAKQMVEDLIEQAAGGT